MKKEKIKYGSVLMSAMLLMLSASLAFAGPGGRGGAMGKGFGGQSGGTGPGYCWSGDRASNLNLTEEQSGKLQALRENHLREIIPLRTQMISLRSEMRILWIAATPDRDKILAKQKELSNIQAQLDEKAVVYRFDCRAMLTPEQQAKMAAFGPGMGRGHGPGWNHGGKW
jgi:periplasmic protein CpxP/Spy